MDVSEGTHVGLKGWERVRLRMLMMDWRLVRIWRQQRVNAF